MLLHGWLTGRTVAFVLGVASASAVMEVVGAPLKRAARSAAREIIRGSLLASREIKRISDGLTQEVEDITAEVRADLEHAREAEGEAPARAAAPARADGRPRRARKA
jgi:hypothetical protein